MPRVLEHRTATDGGAEDRLVLALEGAYPAEAGVASQTRTIILQRQPPRGVVVLEDRIRFATGPGRITSVLTTFAPVEVAAARVRICGERAILDIEYDQGKIAVQAETIPDVDFPDGPRAVNPILFTPHLATEEACIRLCIRPT